MERKILKTTIAIMLIITLSAINFISVGAGIVSYAVDNIVAMEKTNHDNVGFSAYLKNDKGEKLANSSLDINSESIKLYLNVEVRKEGYFNGKIKLKDANFEFISSENEYVNKVTKDTINLNQINAGSSPEIEVIVKPTIKGNFDLGLLNMESKLDLEGIYRDSTEKDIKVSGKDTVQISYVSIKPEENVVNNLEVITNKIGMYNGEEKRIVQVKAKLGMKDGIYPVKHITSQINVPQINDEEPQIEHKVTLKGMQNYKYNYEKNMVTIEIDNDANTQNEIKWAKDGNEEVILTYIYDKDVLIDNEMIASKEEITLHDGKTLSAQEVNVIINKDVEKDGIITLDEKVEGLLYKGKVYAGVDKEYTTNTQIQVNLDKLAETVYVNENETSIPSKYKTTTINKKELISLLGENGKLEISTKIGDLTRGIMTITRTTEEDENGNIVVEYPKDVSNIIIRTTKPQNAGNLNLKHSKVIEAKYKDQIRNASELITTLDGRYEAKGSTKGIIEKIETKTELKETTTEASLELDRDNLITVSENKEVQIKATLKSNAEQYDLYTNPTFEIEFPADVTEVKVNSINKIYGEEFTEIKPSQTVVNGKHVIRVELKGTQTEYKEEAIEGTQILINANITLNNKATSKTDTMKMTYTNENANQYKDLAEFGTEIVNMSIVSPKGMITVNNMKDLEIETIGEQEKVEKQLDINKEAKQVRVESEIINNNEAQVNQVGILGKFATDSQENNLHAVLKSGLNIESADIQDAKIYYTENENANTDIANNENGWQEQATPNAKKYLITIPDMQVAEDLKVSYDMEIPANLEYNQKASESYEVQYVQSDTGVAQLVNSTIIGLATQEAPEEEKIETVESKKPEEIPTEDISVTLEMDGYSGNITGNIDVGGNTSYIATIKNNTNSEQKNIKLTWKLPEELGIISQLLFSDEAYSKFNDPNYTGEEDIKELDNDKEITIESIPANSSFKVYILVEASQIKDASKPFSIQATVQNGEKTYNSPKVDGQIKNVKLFTASLSASKENEYVKAGDEIEYTIKLKNNNDIIINSLSLEDNIPEGLSITSIKVGNEQEQVPDSNYVMLPINFAPGEEKEVKISTIVNYKQNREDETITNKASLYISNSEEIPTNEVSHEILANKGSGITSNEVVNEDGSISYTYKINGMAWEDENRDGQRQDNEARLAGIRVQLLNVKTNEIAKNPQGENITAITNDAGNYTLDKVSNGEYIAVFEYDTSTYALTNYSTDRNRTSNVVAKKANINGEEKTYGVTDTIQISDNNISNVNIGLAKSQKFDMKLEKFVSKIVVQNSEGTQTYNYNDETLAKVELYRKAVQGANVIIEYKIRVTNEGELEGYVKNIVDYLPNDLTFSSEINSDWYKEGNNVYNNTIGNKKLAPGESKEVTLTVTKTMTEDNTGLINNLAEIAQDYSGSSVTDINSTPGNKTQGENDLGSADVIISVRTGENLMFGTLVVIALGILSVTAIFIYKEIKFKKEEKII